MTAPAGRDGTVRGDFSRLDGTVKCNGKYFLDGTGRYESTVFTGEIVDGTGQRFHFDDEFTVPSRPVRPVPSLPSIHTVLSINHEKKLNITNPNHI